MNNDLCEGHKVIQGYLDTKNPLDSWVTASYGITYWYCNRLWQLSRKNLKMANYLGGTGMCFELPCLRKWVGVQQAWLRIWNFPCAVYSVV